VANFYFLSLVILQLFPPFNNVSFAVNVFPIALIVSVTALKVVS
jgi:hypothetical protein